MSRRLWAGLLLAALAAAARAEPLYVIEQLVVSVNSSADASGERIATLKSGDRVEAIERSGEQVHVRLPGGKDGWVRASYLSADEPLRVRLTQRDAELAQLKDQLSGLQQQLHAATTRPNTAAAAPAPAATAAEEPASPAAAMFSSAGEERPARLWPWTLAAALLGVGLGFALGALVLDRHIRRKYGGLRIY